MSPAAPFQRESDGWRFATDPTLLMRFSAATANAHRIHYDWPYPTRIEGYPGLVVHGPLSTLVLAETLRLTRPGRSVRRITHRIVAPLFCGQDAFVTLATATAPSDTSVEVTLRVDDGTPVALLNADLAPLS
jgi:3-methylfumaryl-CoA hydratase